MKYGISKLSIVPMRSQSSDKEEMTNQILFGEHFKVLEMQKKWSKISWWSSWRGRKSRSFEKSD